MDNQTKLEELKILKPKGLEAKINKFFYEKHFTMEEIEDIEDRLINYVPMNERRALMRHCIKGKNKYAFKIRFTKSVNFFKREFNIID